MCRRMERFEDWATSGKSPLTQCGVEDERGGPRQRWCCKTWLADGRDIGEIVSSSLMSTSAWAPEERQKGQLV